MIIVTTNLNCGLFLIITRNFPPKFRTGFRGMAKKINLGIFRSMHHVQCAQHLSEV